MNECWQYRRLNWKAILLCCGAGIALLLLVRCVISRQTELATFYSAISAGDLERVRQSIANGIDIDYTWRRFSGFRAGEPQRIIETPLFVAAREGHTEVVRVLLDAGAKLDERCTEGGTALTIASSRSGRCDIVNLLLQYGADPLQPQPMGRSALHWSIVSGDVCSFESLLESALQYGITQQTLESLEGFALKRRDAVGEQMVDALRAVSRSALQPALTKPTTLPSK